jgi:type 1 fimbria pilin
MGEARAALINLTSFEQFYPKYNAAISYNAYRYPHMTRDNRSIYTDPITITATLDSTLVLNLLNTNPGVRSGWILDVNTAATPINDPNYGLLWKYNDTWGFVIKINDQAVNGTSIIGDPLSSTQNTLTAKVQVIAVQLKEPSTKPDSWENLPEFNFKLAATANIATILDTGIVGTSKEYRFTVQKLPDSFNAPGYDYAGGGYAVAYVSQCHKLKDNKYAAITEDNQTITLDTIHSNDFNASGESTVSATFTLSANNCGAPNDAGDKLWRNDIQKVYVTFSDQSQRGIGNDSTILKHDGSASGVGLRIYPEGNPNPVRYTPNNTRVMGFPEMNMAEGQLKADGRATEMNYTLGSPQDRIADGWALVNGIWTYYYDHQNFPVQIGSATKTFRVRYVKIPGETVQPGTVAGKVTFTFSYQ